MPNTDQERVLGSLKRKESMPSQEHLQHGKFQVMLVLQAQAPTLGNPWLCCITVVRKTPHRERKPDEEGGAFGAGLAGRKGDTMLPSTWG